MDFGLCWTNNAPSEAGICSGGDLNQSGSPLYKANSYVINMSDVNHNLLVQVVRDLKAAKGWSRIQWKQVAREYLKRSHLSASLNTPAFRTRLSKLYHKTPNKPDKPEVTVTGTKSIEEQIEERRANAEAGGIWSLGYA